LCSLLAQSAIPALDDTEEEDVGKDRSPILATIMGVVAVACWIVYWREVSGYSRRIAIPVTRAADPGGATPAASV
jgi:ABC-type uncharacterized transport system permease subunit